ncbi:hypothetical protein EVAR_26895_1 [Eumeta japonica]|uniref:Uncharacterized protein n=1 Tax=Eumeta variegata TaxID=151549 RepID=A0A4C1VSU3_EUMVA|nr:hypothetical protein EVAR_26895_1 [Eumeta japonica]
MIAEKLLFSTKGQMTDQPVRGIVIEYTIAGCRARLPTERDIRAAPIDKANLVYRTRFTSILDRVRKAH